jgi:hypothetical protein
MLLVDEKIPARPRLRLVMKRLVESVAAADLGDPVTGGTGYMLCFYDDAGVRVGTLALPEGAADCTTLPGACWRALGGAGFRYSDRNGVAHGIRRVLLKGGPAGTGKVLVRARVVPGRSLSSLPPGLPLALVQSGSATIQLTASDGRCLSLTTDLVGGADAARFSARRR